MRRTFGRVDAIAALVDLLSNAEGLDDVKVMDASSGDPVDEYVYFGDLTGEITQGPFRGPSESMIDDDEFVIPVHVVATRTAAQATSLDARRRAEEFMSAVRQTIATKKKLEGLDGVMYVTNDGADTPMPQPTADPVGWIGFGTVRVRVKIRMQ